MLTICDSASDDVVGGSLGGDFNGDCAGLFGVFERWKVENTTCDCLENDLLGEKELLLF